ncbi:SDR family NAD(P)-dependent oxidoreductase [Actinomycetospora chiangmaiensis]|uniref:SDR family NAD(P)-dependent oxidoreductase n=1 Tax=Actinomycetospora chiangmaiensis TaxID=402650 RepID=UPI00035C5835|nr:SDR family NAD(P)-dependent oxidoreductase [Actinomycetospora chiangmaiensis]
MSSVRDKVTVVTGAGSGIGRRLALELARRGARLAISDVNETGLTETADLAKALGAEVHTARLDVADREAVLAYAAAVEEHYGVVHQVYNNAGVASSGTVLDGEWSEYDHVLGINLFGVINGTKAFLPAIVRSGDGHVINVSSLNGIMAQPGMSAYCTAKFGVRGFTETLRTEMLAAGKPVAVTVVHPGGVKTNIATAAFERGSAAGQTTAADEARVKAYNEKLLKMPADQAATIIVDGVESGKPRVLVGNDAKLVDLFVRLVPRFYPAALVRFGGKVIGGR